MQTKLLGLLMTLGLWLFLSVQTPVQAQNKSISGTVRSSEDNSPMSGVTVRVKGTNTGAQTNSTGRYTVTATPTSTLIFSFVGFNTQEVVVGNRTTIDVVLQLDEKTNEVVIVGYGTEQKASVTGSVTSIKGAEISTLVAPSFATQLAGRAAGVQVTVPNGLLGQSPRIRVRGTNSISSGADPLIVIDNVPVTGNPFGGVGPADPLSDINPNDIESYEILKDGAATAIFGSRAANGVILITTKRGRGLAGLGMKTAVNYDFNIGNNEPVNRLSLLNAAQFIEIANEKYKNAGQPEQAKAGTNGEDTDWQNVIFRTGLVQNHALSLNGTTDKTNYFFSLGYLNNEGPIVANSQERYTFRANLDHSVTKRLTLGTSLSYSRSQFSNLNTGGNALSGNVTGAARLLPNVSPYDAANTKFDGYNVTADGAALGQGNNLRPVDNNFTNLAFVLAKNKFITNNNRIIGNAYAELQIIPGLRLKTLNSVDLLTQDDFQSLDPRHGDGRGSNGVIVQVFRPVTQANSQNTLSFNKTLGGKHNVSAVTGLEFQKRTSRTTVAQGTNFSELFFMQNNLIGGSYGTQQSSGGYVQDAFDSYFGRVNYNYADRYYISLTARNDGLSSLPEANRRGTFPGGSLAWRPSQEAFFKNSGIKNVISDLRFRASYAVVGNTNIGFFPYAGTFGVAQYANQTGIAFSNTGNPDLKWEQSKKKNFGVDLGLLNKRINLNVDYFINDVDNLVLFAPTAPSLGVPGNGINKNIGSLQNKGYEIVLDANLIKTNSFSWNLNLNYTGLQNKITALNNNEDVIFTYHINRVGLPIGSFYGYKWAGVNAANGNPMWYKADGVAIVQYDIATGTYRAYNATTPSNIATTATLSASADRVVLGSSNPTFQGGITNQFRFKSFDLEVFARFSGGNMIMNVTRQETLLNQGFQNNGTEILDRWTTAGQVTNVPKLWIGREAAINNTGAADSRFLEKGDFFRIQNIVLGYTMPTSLVSKAHIQGMRVFGQVQNAFISTKYTGLDPELSSSTGNSTFGIDQSANPIIRSISFGVNLKL